MSHQPTSHDTSGTRNRAPCANCKISKRKCDRARSRCSRCRQRGLPCIPSATAQWRVNSITQNARHSNAPSPPATRSTPRRRRGSIYPRSPETHHQNDPQIEDSSDLATHSLLELPIMPENEQGISLNGPISAEYGGLRARQLDLRSIDNLWAIPPLSPSVTNNTWPLPDDEFFGRFAAPVGDILDTFIDPRVPALQCAVSYLWNEFVERIAPSITLGSSAQINAIIKHLASAAVNKPPLFSAVIFFSQSVQANHGLRDQSFPIDPAETIAVALFMEQEAVSQVDKGVCDETDDASKTDIRVSILLPTLVTLCSAYIARQDMDNLLLCLEHAMRTIQSGFTSGLALDKAFLFFARWIGLIHTTAMLGETPYPINGPDYLTIATEKFHDPSSGRMFFRDVDGFLGLSQTVADLMYRLGHVLRLITPIQNCEHSPACSADLDAQIIGVDTRIQLLLRQLEEFKRHSGLTDDLDHYNQTLVHTCLLILLTRVKKEPSQSELVCSTASNILDCCAMVREDAPVAKLMVLPLFTAGIHTSRPVYHAFIRRRLEVLRSGYCIINVKRTLELLEKRWNLQMSPVDHQLDQECLASVCLLF